MAIKSDEEFRVLVGLLSMLLAGSTFFYKTIEGWSWVDSFYFSVMTVSTIGYGDFTPSTDISKIFTTIFAVFGIGLFVAVNSKLLKVVLADRMNQREH